MIDEICWRRTEHMATGHDCSRRAGQGLSAHSSRLILGGTSENMALHDLFRLVYLRIYNSAQCLRFQMTRWSSQHGQFGQLHNSSSLQSHSISSPSTSSLFYLSILSNSPSNHCFHLFASSSCGVSVGCVEPPPKCIAEGPLDHSRIPRSIYIVY